MSVEAADEELKRGDAPGWGDAVTFSWGDADRGLFGSARLGLGAAGASALALLFDGADVAAAGAEGGIEIERPEWTRISVGDVEASVEEPLRAWRSAWDGDGGGWDLRFDALTEPLPLAAGGVEGYEQGCRVQGTVRVGVHGVEIDCLGQRGHQWGAPDWEGLSMSRMLSAWLGRELWVTVAAVRPAGAEGHADEDVHAWLVAPEDGPGGPVRVDEARLSTTYDGDGRQLRAGLELWTDPDSPYPRRVGGEAVCGTSLELGRLKLDAAFFRWRMEGTEGVGRYDVLRRT